MLTPERSLNNLITGTTKLFSPTFKTIDGFPLHPEDQARLENTESDSTIAYSLKLILNVNCNQSKLIYEDELRNARSHYQQTNVYILKSLQDRLKVVRGSFSQYDEKFPEESRGRQCAAITMAALAFAESQPVHTWNTDMINELIVVGDDTYRRAEKQEIYLNLEEVPKNIQIYAKTYYVSTTNEVAKHMAGNLCVDDLIVGFNKFLALSTKGALVANFYSISFYKEIVGKGVDGVEKWHYFMLDSHRRNAYGYEYHSPIGGTAVLVEFEGIEDMAELITRNFIEINKWNKLESFRSSYPMDGEKPVEFVMYPVVAEVKAVTRRKRT